MNTGIFEQIRKYSLIINNHAQSCLTLVNQIGLSMLMTSIIVNVIDNVNDNGTIKDIKECCMTRKFVTMKDIAEALDISVNTVSRAFNDKADINPETKKRILEKAREMGYLRNSSAAFLRTSETRTIGVIIDDSTNPFFWEVFLGIETSAKKLGYEVILMNFESNTDEEHKAIETLLERRVDGLLISPLDVKGEHLKNLTERGFPFVVFGRKLDDLDVDCIYSKEEKGGYIATKKLIEDGCKNLIMLNSWADTNTTRSREAGFKKALAEFCVPEENYRVFRIFSPDELTSFIPDLIEKGEKFDGIFCFNDMMAYTTMKVLQEKDIRVPEDVEVIGFDNTKFSNLVYPSLTSINIHKFDLGYEAFNILYSKMKRVLKEPKEVILDVELVIRNSTKK